MRKTMYRIMCVSCLIVGFGGLLVPQKAMALPPVEMNAESSNCPSMGTVSGDVSSRPEQYDDRITAGVPATDSSNDALNGGSAPLNQQEGFSSNVTDESSVALSSNQSSNSSDDSCSSGIPQSVNLATGSDSSVDANDTSVGAVLDGWKVDSATGERRWFENGELVCGREFSDPADGSWYYADENGSLVHGVTWIPSNGGKWVYYDMATGAMAYGEKYLSYDADHTGWYHFDEHTGAMSHGTTWISSNGGKWVYYDAFTGQMQYGEQYLSYDAEHTGWYYFDNATGAMQYGFQSLPGTGGKGSNKAGRRWVYYGPNPGDGKMRHGWETIEGKAYYFDPVSGHIQSGSDAASSVAALCFQQDNFGYGGGWCQAWVAKAFYRVGRPYGTRICAWQAMLDWGVSTNRENIPVGATLYGHSSTGSHGDGYADYGHVAIHLPGNMAASLRFGHVDIEPFSAFDATNRYLCWGWNAGDVL